MDNKSYSKGYAAGRKLAYPHGVPIPPVPVLSECFTAATQLRDEADWMCSTLSEDDDFVVRLSPLISAFDDAMIRYQEWLFTSNT